TPVSTGVEYTAKAAAVSDDVKRLYEHYFTGSTMSSTQRAAFQLALWELTNDDGNLYAMPTTGFAPKQYFNTTADAKVTAAAGMLSYALDQSNALTNKYNYIEFDSQGSQSLLSVSAVPEADTWAMMGVGLGLIGLMGRRRKSAQTEKFA
ncbi:MAG: PEP-CTERM sorting domain-containing protein, partial [Sphingomonadaceae bacterium]